MEEDPGVLRVARLRTTQGGNTSGQYFPLRALGPVGVEVQASHILTLRELVWFVDPLVFTQSKYERKEGKCVSPQTSQWEWGYNPRTHALGWLSTLSCGFIGCDFILHDMPSFQILTCRLHSVIFLKNVSHVGFNFHYRLLQLCQRTMALPVGRGMFTLFSYHPVPTEPLPVPKLNLTGMLSAREDRGWVHVHGSSELAK